MSSPETFYRSGRVSLKNATIAMLEALPRVVESSPRISHMRPNLHTPQQRWGLDIVLLQDFHIFGPRKNKLTCLPHLILEAKFGSGLP